jgi:hypothetical protein
VHSPTSYWPVSKRSGWIIRFLDQYLVKKFGFYFKLQVKIPIPTCLGRPDQVSLWALTAKKDVLEGGFFFKAR